MTPLSSRPGFTLDTGALIALERRDRRMAKIYQSATQKRGVVTVPTVAIGEWWRGQSTRTRRMVLGGVTVEPLSERLACLAGEVLARVRGPSLADAVVMASAAQRGDIVVTSDFDDMDRLKTCFTSVRRIIALDRMG